jgi:hypothetical protein
MFKPLIVFYQLDTGAALDLTEKLGLLAAPLSLPGLPLYVVETRSEASPPRRRYARHQRTAHFATAFATAAALSLVGGAVVLTMDYRAQLSCGFPTDRRPFQAGRIPIVQRQCATMYPAAATAMRHNRRGRPPPS